MARTAVFVTMLFLTAIAWSQTNGSAQSSQSNQQKAKKSKDQITAQGCLARSQTDYVLMQSDKGNSYQLERSRKLKLAPYLGQEVEVTGREYPSMSDSSDYLARAGSASPVTIRVKTIKTISPQCSGN
jgi:hypothetical protein